MKCWDCGRGLATNCNANVVLCESCRSKEAARRHEMDMWADGVSKRKRDTRDDDLAVQLEAQEGKGK